MTASRSCRGPAGRLLFSTGAVALGFFLARPAAADTGEYQSSYDPGRAARRSDFALGLLFGGVVGQASGYPNDPAMIDVPRYQTDTGFGAGTGGGLWIGGALRDWFVFGVGLQRLALSASGYQATGTAFILHVEGYPLFARGGVFRDLGLIGEFGAGGQQIKKGPVVLADGGAMSLVQVGVVYEALRLGNHFNVGPLVALTHQFSAPLVETAGIVGVRLTYYGGPD